MSIIKIDENTAEETTKKIIKKDYLLRKREGCVAEVVQWQSRIDEIDVILEILK